MSSLGLGQSVPSVGSGVREMMGAAARISGAVHLEVGEPDWEPPEGVAEAGSHALATTMGYTPSLGSLELRERVAARTAERAGMSVGVEMVAVTPGAVCAVACLSMLLSGPEHPILIPDATWPNYMLMPALSGARALHYPVIDGAPDLDYLRNLRLDGALLVLNTPANPTGAVFDEGVLAELLALAESRSWWVLADDIYEDLVWAGESPRPARIAGRLDRLALVSGVSKSFAMTGYRVGWLVATPTLVARVEPLLEALVSCPSSASQLASVAALEAEPGYLDGVRSLLAGRAAAVAAACSGVGLLPSVPKAGMYAWLNLGPKVADARRFALELLKEESVAIAPGSAFGPGGHGHARIALTGSPDTLKDAVSRLVRFWMAA